MPKRSRKEVAGDSRIAFSFDYVIDTQNTRPRTLSSSKPVAWQRKNRSHSSSSTFFNPAIETALPIIYDAAFRKERFSLIDVVDLCIKKSSIACRSRSCVTNGYCDTSARRACTTSWKRTVDVIVIASEPDRARLSHRVSFCHCSRSNSMTTERHLHHTRARRAVPATVPCISIEIPHDERQRPGRIRRRRQNAVSKSRVSASGCGFCASMSCRNFGMYFAAISRSSIGPRPGICPALSFCNTVRDAFRTTTRATSSPLASPAGPR